MNTHKCTQLFIYYIWYNLFDPDRNASVGVIVGAVTSLTDPVEITIEGVLARGNYEMSRVKNTVERMWDKLEIFMKFVQFIQLIHMLNIIKSYLYYIHSYLCYAYIHAYIRILTCLHNQIWPEWLSQIKFYVVVIIIIMFNIITTIIIFTIITIII